MEPTETATQVSQDNFITRLRQRIEECGDSEVSNALVRNSGALMHEMVLSQTRLMDAIIAHNELVTEVSELFGPVEECGGIAWLKINC